MVYNRMKDLSLTSALYELHKQATVPEKERIEEMLFHYINEYKLNKEQTNQESAASNAQIFVDTLIQDQMKKPESILVKCKSGCYYCYEQNVDITEDEAALIVKWCKQVKIPINKKKLKRQARYLRSKWHKQNFHDRRCVFLKKNLCSIYEYRPVNCRKYMVTSDPKLCDTTTTNRVEMFVDYHVEVMASAPLNVVESGPMPVMLLKELKKDGNNDS